MSNIENIDLADLASVLNNDNNRYVILLEDIDTIFNLDRKEGKGNRDDKKIINNLLQFLDSKTSPNNAIFIATTNYVDRLDSAILRDGRFDIKIEVKGICKETAKKMCQSFNLSSSDIDTILKDETYPINQSYLQNKILNKIKENMINEK